MRGRYKYNVEKRKKIEEMYFIQKMSLTNIAQKLDISVSYVSRILKRNENYYNEQIRRKEENQLNIKAQQKELIYKQRKEMAIQKVIENQIMKKLHEQASIELSKRRTLSDEVLRNWCSLYKYNKEKECYQFDLNKSSKPNDFPMYIRC